MFLNTEELMKRPEEVKADDAEVMTKFLDWEQEADIPKLKYGIGHAYLALLEALC